MRICNVYLRGNETLIMSAAKTIPGFEIHAEPVFRLVDDQPDAAVGHAVLKALDSYREKVPPPSPEVRGQDPVLRSAGVSSWGQLERSSSNILITEEAGMIKAIPTQRRPGGAYLHLNNLAIQCRADAEEIGAALRQAVAFCS